MSKKIFKTLIFVFLFASLWSISIREPFAQQLPLCGSLVVSPSSVSPGERITIQLSVANSSDYNKNFAIGIYTNSGDRYEYGQIYVNTAGYGTLVYSGGFPIAGQFLIHASRNADLPMRYDSNLSCSATNLTVFEKEPGSGEAGQPKTPTVSNTSDQVRLKCPTSHISTAIGCVPIADINKITKFFLQWAVGIAGGVALLLIGLAAYRIMTSQGDPRRLQGAQELLLSAIGGLIMIVLSIYLLRFIGVDLLGLF